MMKLERKDVTRTELLESSECFTSNQDSIRKELALESCESICRKIELQSIASFGGQLS